MHRLMTAVALGLAMLQAASLDDSATARRKYDALTARVTGGDMEIDWRELRLASVVAQVNGSFDWREANKQFKADFNAGKFEEALKQARAMTSHNTASLDGHFDAYIAYKRLDQATEEAREKAILGKLLGSIAASGDGKTAATAWFTVDPSEEYVFIGLFLGMQPAGQALVNQDGHAYDKMTIKDAGGKEVTVWFNTDTDMQMTAKAFAPKPK